MRRSAGFWYIEVPQSVQRCRETMKGTNRRGGTYQQDVAGCRPLWTVFAESCHSNPQVPLLENRWRSVLCKLLLNEVELSVGPAIGIFHSSAGNCLVRVDDKLVGLHTRPNLEFMLPGVDSEKKAIRSNRHHPVGIAAIEMRLCDGPIAGQEFFF